MIDVPKANFDKYKTRWKIAQSKPSKQSDIAWFSKKALTGRARYEALQGLPWYLIAFIHGEEAGFDFNCCLHNGDPWNKPTHNYPPGIGPFHSWEESSKDAIRRILSAYMLTTTPPTIEEIMYIAERHNGMGYEKRGVPSPYLYSFTNIYVQGRYVKDGVYDPHSVSHQVGFVAFIKDLVTNYGVDLGLRLDNAPELV